MMEAYSCARTFHTVAAAPSGAVVVARGVGAKRNETSPSTADTVRSSCEIIWSTPGAKSERVEVGMTGYTCSKRAGNDVDRGRGGG